MGSHLDGLGAQGLKHPGADLFIACNQDGEKEVGEGLKETARCWKAQGIEKWGAYQDVC